MPITCPITIPRLTTQEFGELDYSVMRHVFDCHSTLGRLADENIYQADLAGRLVIAGFDVHIEVPITLSFDGFTKTYRIDLVVAEKGVYELKTVAKLTSEHEAQLMNYLLMLDCVHGKLVNFRTPSVESRFVNAPVTSEARTRFTVHVDGWQADTTVRDWVVALLRDWGTGLELPLYHQAIVHHLGGPESILRQIPLFRDGCSLGNQRFHCIGSNAAFRLTAFTQDLSPYAQQLMRLLNHCELTAIHWINIAKDKVTFTTVTKP